MRRVSKRTLAAYAEHGPARKQFLTECPECAECGGQACDVHEILAGADRHKAFKERCCWLALCRRCHDELQGTDKIRQLALKLLQDPGHFDLISFHRIWCRPVTAITAAEVLEALRQVLYDRKTQSSY